MSDTTAEPMPYEEVTSDAYLQAAVEFAAGEIQGAVVLRGACPRCGDSMEFVWADDAIRGTKFRRKQPPKAERVIHMLCTCAVEHPGGAPGTFGCGAYWNVAISG